MSLSVLSTLMNAASPILNSLLESKPMALRAAIVCLDKSLSWINTAPLASKQIAQMPKELEREPFNVLMLQVCVNLIPEQEETDARLAPLVEEVFQEPSNGKAALKTVNFLIANGVAPQEIAAEFSNLNVNVPSSIYTDWGLLNALGYQSYMGSIASNIKAIRHNGTGWVCHNWSAILGTWAAIEMISQIPSAHADSSICEAPAGSYRKTCDVKSIKTYHSSDPYLADIKFCEYIIDCHKTEWSKIENNRKILALEDIQCISNMENCDGILITRSEGIDNLCLDTTLAQKTANLKKEL